MPSGTALLTHNANLCRATADHVEFTSRGVAQIDNAPATVPPTVTKWITDGALVIVAMDGPKLAGVLFTSEKAQASALPVVAMLKAWPGSADAYVYGPVCVDQAARGLGVLEAMYAHALACLPGREAVLFINAGNTRSLKAHARLGMVQVADFTLGEQAFAVLSSRREDPVRK